MTKKDAKKYFVSLYKSILSNGFSDVGAFVNLNEDEISSLDNLKKMFDEVQSDKKEVLNLKILIKAIKTYFKKSKSLQNQIYHILSSLNIKNVVETNNLITKSGIDISGINSELHIILLEKIDMIEQEMENSRGNDNDMSI